MRALFTAALTAACLMALLPDDVQAKFVCGQFEEGFTCKYVPGSPSAGPTGQYKGPPVAPKDRGAPAPVPMTSEPQAAPDSGWSASTSQPPPPSAGARTCPPNTELLGGNCVPYTARCTALAANALPQPCAGVEEKQMCKPRADGLKDCCCITYSKF